MPLSTEEIIELLDKIDSEAKAIKKEVIRMCWFMRGGITYDEAMNLSLEERNMISELVKDNLETTKTTKLPFF